MLGGDIIGLCQGPWWRLETFELTLAHSGLWDFPGEVDK